MSEQRTTNDTGGNERIAALLSNASALRAVASAVEGTIGPKGLDTMLVDRLGDVVVTNDGWTILERMEATHPAARMLINIARAQHEEIGDGTTTATIMASALVQAGLDMVADGVPVPRLIEGVRIGARAAIEALERSARPIQGLCDPWLVRVANTAGRGHEDIAALAVEAAKVVGLDNLLDPAFNLRDAIVAEEGARSEVFRGVIVRKARHSRHMPASVAPARILALDDALEPERVDEGALATERGIEKHFSLKEGFERNLRQLVECGINVILVSGGLADIAEDMLVDAGVVVVTRMSWRDLRRAAEHTGARLVKRSWIARSSSEMERVLGAAERVFEDERVSEVRIVGGRGRPMATMVVGASTSDVVEERERIAHDAVCAVQAAVRGGIVPGGGAAEIAAARSLASVRREVKGMAAYGVDCVLAALKRPLAQIVQNAGYNPLEKVEEAITAQAASGNDSLAVDCDTGAVADMLSLGVVDPAQVKLNALRAAAEVGEAVLRIDRIVKKREDQSGEAKEAGM
ncbi:MAG: TCP-1/cpn60 chaperonin family protein [Firmicutes bacterium]|nr:TCP-1/cpn60 chaperonin family protein [Bacillota bacterium]MDH7495007.1 TCP-1/cpn60 chaperonin family protein [Bacillota bacterium]